ncbi:hypothetical protein Pst134EB_010983 [Puccinia striiformis f. sp. tritici]|uniref:CID domain-containing protein n=1 Tax=Puccinia striiformis f. sp. tritici PST-78 TaxID=1165861 RepID=A0A0L0URV4_9BASI|nr:hypothetical protein Pst134EB_010983 [Puccinia striiformis f. sp. tritici]KNE89827.1 hypothetical protein PSTG_16727 [Puccinia striiformis f. sp. tritici PST-78]
MQGLPAPPPSIGYDVNEFRRFFKFGLDQLQYNNKYIINDLTTLASVHHHRMSTYIVKDIEQHIRNSHPTHRLIGFYVLDSICKNLGHPFPQLFKPFIERLFLIAYRDIEDVDPLTKVKFEELLGTWRTGSANQTELFDPDIQRRIEESVFGNWRRDDSIASQAFLSGIKQQPAVATPAEKASILYDVRRILSEREQVAATYPGDQTNLAQMTTLQQLEQLIASQQLTINQVDDIRRQLQPLKASILPPAPVEYGIPPSHLPAVVHQMDPLPTPHNPIEPFGDSDSLASLTRLLETNPNILLQAVNQSMAFPAHQEHSIQQHQTPLNFDDPNVQLAINHMAQLSQPPVAPSVPQLTQELANTNMFDSEQLAAALAYLNPTSQINSLLPELGSQELPIELIHQPSPAPSTLSTSESITTSQIDPTILEYENMIAGLPIELQNSSINRVKPAEIADVLYSHIPQFCRQDGSRFLYGKVGSQRASEQLDRHFRLQRRVRESGQRAQQRMWSQLHSEWLDSHDFGSTGSGENSQVEANQRKKRKSIEEDKSVNELSKKSIIRPSSPGLASQPCPICQEPFETRLDEDEDEFYWTNAIELTKEAGKRVVYHATCHYETIRNKARMKIKFELEENRLKQKIQTEADLKTHGENGKVEQANGSGYPFTHEVIEVGEASSRSSSNNDNQPVDSTSGGDDDDDDDDKCLLQVDESFFGETETVANDIKLESSDLIPLVSSEPRLSNDPQVKSEPETIVLPPHRASSPLLGKRKPSPIVNLDPSSDLNDPLVVPHSEVSSKKSKLS